MADLVMTKKEKKRFDAAVLELNQLMDELRDRCPEANYYLAMEDLCILKGESHDAMTEQARKDSVVYSGCLWYSGGGDW